MPRRRDGSYFWEPPVLFITGVYVTVFLFCGVFYSVRGKFVDPQVAVRSLEKQGYSHVKIVDQELYFPGFHGCDARDAALFVVQATNPVGKDVEVNVCVGWPFKGATIRTD